MCTEQLVGGVAVGSVLDPLTHDLANGQVVDEVVNAGVPPHVAPREGNKVQSPPAIREREAGDAEGTQERQGTQLPVTLAYLLVHQDQDAAWRTPEEALPCAGVHVVRPPR